MTYLETKRLAHEHKCPDCQGLGTQDDCEPGDIGFNERVCPACKGNGWKDGIEVLIPAQSK